MLSKLHSLNLKLSSTKYNKNFVLHLIVAPQLSGGWQHYYSTQTRQAGHANEQSVYYLISMVSQPTSFPVCCSVYLSVCITVSGSVLLLQLLH